MAPAGTPLSLSGSIASEKAVVEVPAVELLQSLGWQHGDLMQEEPGAKNPTGRLSSERSSCLRASAPHCTG
jgi:hypothetical protein